MAAQALGAVAHRRPGDGLQAQPPADPQVGEHGALDPRRVAGEHGEDTLGISFRQGPAGVALAGVALAALGLLASGWLGSETPDALASLLLGLLLAATAFGLARPLADLLVGRSVPVEELRQAYAILAAAPAVDAVLAVQAVNTGPAEVVVAAKVRPVGSLTVGALTAAMDELDRALRAALPEVAEVYIDVTAYRSETTPTDGADGREPRPASAPPGQQAPDERKRDGQQSPGGASSRARALAEACRDGGAPAPRARPLAQPTRAGDSYSPGCTHSPCECA
ncbi:MAG TPA: hypothetical protein VHS99_22685 [Chloroflexota bacterium]|nr:hypothetical protein [Chloroflexota bacterium]